MLIFHCKKEKAGLMFISHSGTWIQVTFCDLLKYFQCPTGESFFSKLALSSSLSPSVLLQKAELCRAVCLHPAKCGILEILNPRANLSDGRGKSNAAAVMGHYFCPAVAPGMM